MSTSSMFTDLASKLIALGYHREPYIIGPLGMGVLRLQMSSEVYGYVSFAFYKKYQKIGIGLGFGHPDIKRAADMGLSAVGKVQGITPAHSINNPCPAVLFPLEFYVGPREGQPIDLGEECVARVRQLVHEQVFAGRYSWINTRKKLCDFLVNGEAPFEWMSGGIPRRLCQAAYLLHAQHAPFEEALRLLISANAGLQNDADFAGYRGDFALDVLKFFYSA